ncbi:unnamed protein product [Eruca vesicaria subsp. sativa]|uniref:Uncharacterized protein n=1 Tax=Eruca vesicaria subsp. sativa TaxID=29727 RepID=A0ABC8LFT1_ERUVS|nr:unnamed protein product [Eruca vesicaria subsp. sativa]
MLILCGIESVMPLTPLLEEMKALKSGPLLPHCVEAALNLGCIAVPINLGSVYPLYYGSDNQTQQVNMSLRVPETPIITGMPISIKAPEERTESLCDLSLRLGLSSSDPPSTRIDVGF